MAFPRKFRVPTVTGRTRKELPENSALMKDRPSETIVPVPTALSVGISCLTSVPKLEPVCCTGASRYPMARR
jgi:hypothetical protein